MKSRLFFCFVLVATQFCNYLHAMEQDNVSQKKNLSVLVGTFYNNGKNKKRYNTFCNTDNLFGVFDGHGKYEYFKRIKNKFYKKFSSLKEDNVECKLKKTFELIEKDFSIAEECDYYFTSRSMPVVAVMDSKNNNLWVASVGTSRCVILNKNKNGLYSVEHQTEDHNLENPTEMGRIKNLSGKCVVVPCKNNENDKKVINMLVQCPQKEWKKIIKRHNVTSYNNSFLYRDVRNRSHFLEGKGATRCTRFIGGIWLKERCPGVYSSKPDFYQFRIDNETVAILATTSLWKQWKNQDIANILNECQEEDAQSIADKLGLESPLNGNNENRVVTVLKFSDKTLNNMVPVCIEKNTKKLGNEDFNIINKKTEAIETTEIIEESEFYYMGPYDRTYNI